MDSKFLGKLLAALEKRLRLRLQATWNHKHSSEAFSKALEAGKRSPFVQDPSRVAADGFDSLTLMECVAIVDRSFGGDCQLFEAERHAREAWRVVFRWIQTAEDVVKRSARRASTNYDVYALAAGSLMIAIGYEPGHEVEPEVCDWVDALHSRCADSASREDVESALMKSVDQAASVTRDRVASYLLVKLGDQSLQWAMERVGEIVTSNSSWKNGWDVTRLNTLFEKTKSKNSLYDTGEAININASLNRLLWDAVMCARNKSFHTAIPFAGFYFVSLEAIASYMDCLGFSVQGADIRKTMDRLFNYQELRIRPMKNLTSQIMLAVMAAGTATFATLYFSQGANQVVAPTAGSPVEIGSKDRGQFPKDASPATRAQEPAPSSGEGALASASRDRRASDSPPPETPSAYADSIKGQTRTWMWSTKSMLDRNEMLVHWETCQGVLNMKESNKASMTGTIESVRIKAGILPVKLCRFCYEVEFLRRAKDGTLPAPGTATK